MKRTLSVASVFLVIVATIVWAAPRKRAAQIFSAQDRSGRRALDSRPVQNRAAKGTGTQPSIPGTVRLRNVAGRGLVVSTWVNGVGSFEFAVDTGVGTTLVSERVAQQASISQGSGATVRIAGLSGVEQAIGRKAVLRNVALGGPDNVLPGQVKAIVTNNLPPGVDGVLEPTDAYSPLGFAIDLPRSEISAFDPRTMPIRASDAPADGAVVPWLSDGATRRPFVMLSNGRRALLDTGSAFGFAVSENVAHDTGLLSIEASENRAIRDIGGSSIGSRRVSPATIAIGGLTLKRVPTDILSGVELSAPILLGRAALRPFHLAFDPLHRLILIAPSSGRNQS